MWALCARCVVPMPYRGAKVRTFSDMAKFFFISAPSVCRFGRVRAGGGAAAARGWVGGAPRPTRRPRGHARPYKSPRRPRGWVGGAAAASVHL